MNENGFNGKRRPYGEYQKRIFLECLEDAREISSRYIEVVMTLYLSTHQPAGKFFSI